MLSCMSVSLPLEVRLSRPVIYPWPMLWFPPVLFHLPSGYVSSFFQSDPFGMGCSVYLGRSGHDFFSILALPQYLSLSGDTAGPLFIWRDGSPLSPHQVNFYLQDLLSCWYPGHILQPQLPYWGRHRRCCS